MRTGAAAATALRRFLLESPCRAPGCEHPANVGAYCWQHGPESAELARERDPERPPITAADLLALLASRIDAEGPVELFGEPVRLVLDGADLRVYRKGETVWAGRLVAYPAALKLDAAEAGKVYPCPRCGGPVTANLAQDQPAGDCPGCGAGLRLVVQGRPEGGRWRDLNRWAER